jgi:hypothetical protein
MNITDFFKKKATTTAASALSDVAKKMPGMPDTKDMNMLQKFAMKRLEKMSPAERQKMMQKALNPKNIAKHKGEIIQTLEAMKKAGQMSDDQYRLAKRKFGLDK